MVGFRLGLNPLEVNGCADLIVCGDPDLLARNPFREIPMIPRGALVRGHQAIAPSFLAPRGF
jgi:hypothetical protein